MADYAAYKSKIEQRLDELGVRLHEIEDALDAPKTADLNDQAIDLEDDEVLEGIGNAGLKEARLLRDALERIEKGTYGTCLSCEEPISPERLDAVPYAALCRDCAARAAG